MNRVTAILPAAGLGTRMGADTPKQFLALDGVPVLLFTLRRLAACPAITDFVIATRAEEVDSVAASVASEKLGRSVHVVRGGDTRQDSVANALAEVPSEADLILVHDAVRPLVTLSQIERVIAEAAACVASTMSTPSFRHVLMFSDGGMPLCMRCISMSRAARSDRYPDGGTTSMMALTLDAEPSKPFWLWLSRPRSPGRPSGWLKAAIAA